MGGGTGAGVGIHGEWSSRWAFILATSGSAIGLGNLWKFPYVTGVNGGGAFVLVYLLCIVLVGLPIMIAEVMLGRRARQSPINAMRSLAAAAGARPAWQLLGWGGVVAGFLILSFYSVIGGWAVGYVFNAAAGKFQGAGADEVNALFGKMAASPWHMLFLHTIFLAFTVAVVARGVRAGLERMVMIMMPMLFLLVLLLVGYAMASGAFMQGVHFMFDPDFSALTPTGVIVAMGHAFFTLSLGMGAVMVYGSYMPQRASIVGASSTIVVLDTVVSLLAGLMIFPLVFASGLEPGAGPGLMFQTLPLAFGEMPGGLVFGTLFFILLTFAAWTSAISLVEPTVAWLVENRGFRRGTAAALCGALAWLLGIGTVLSFNHWEELRLFGRSFFETLDFLASNILLPLGGLFIAVFAGWVLPKTIAAEELATHPALLRGWRIIVRYVSPTAVFVVLLHLLGALPFG